VVLPVVPAVRGAIAVRVQHPANNALLNIDSTFIFGTVGTGDARLRINGRDIPVAENGAFLGFVAVPRPAQPGDTLALVLDVTRADATGVITDSARRVIRVRRSAVMPLPLSGPLVVDSASVQPQGSMRVQADELVRVSVRAPANATAWVRTGDARTVPLVRTADVNFTTAQAASARALAPVNSDNGMLFTGEVRADQLTSAARLIVARDADTMRFTLGNPDVQLPTSPRVYGVLRSRATGLVAQSDTDRVVAARPIPDGFSKWALLPGTQLEITGVQGSQTRVRFDSQLETWVPTDDIVPLAEGTPGARRLAGGMRVLPTREYVDVIIPTGMRPAFLVEPDDQKLVLTLYDTRLSPEISPMIGNDPLVQQLAWDPVATDRTRLEVRLSQPVFGWLALWDDNRRAFVLRVRRVPPINASRPLAGLVLAVDAGHPPGGATGPTGLTEADAVLPVAQRLATMLRARGATVVMTRDTRETVALTDRPVITRRAGAHAFLSVHLNAFGDGTNPFTNHGTSTLFFHQMSEPLARFVQTELMKQIGQRDLGIHYQSLAIARPTWYPSILAEGLFLMFPDQEAAMRREDWQERYARAIADGAEKYFEALGKRVYGDRDQQ
jgi:N-acetylmuramoyl-L-alanine amidase